MSKTGKFIAGAILGAAATALLTPVSGKKVRAKINSTAKKAGFKTEKYEAKLQDIVEQGALLLRNLSEGRPARLRRAGKTGKPKKK